MTEVQPGTTSPMELLATGRRHLAVREYSTAASVLANACEALAKEHGEAADQCAEAYLWYGKALLGLSREESGVLGDGMPGANNAEEEGDDEDDNGEPETENGKTDGEKNDATETNGETETQEAESSAKDESMTEAKTNGDTEAGGSGENGSEEAVLDNEDDVDNLQLAWEMLDLARSILEKRAAASSDAGARALLADTHLALGEVALESETYDKAVVDMMCCLELQKELYGGDDRRIAETHYQIGLANSLASNFEDAITHFKNATNILESRIKTLETPTTKGDSNNESEIRELKALLPELKEKIQDMLEYQAETKKRIREQLFPSNGDGASSSSAFTTNGAGSSSDANPKPAADITHLIKRKRKSSENEAEGSAAKRANT